jgi:hypothetical protein
MAGGFRSLLAFWTGGGGSTPLLPGELVGSTALTSTCAGTLVGLGNVSGTVTQTTTCTGTLIGLGNVTGTVRMSLGITYSQGIPDGIWTPVSRARSWIPSTRNRTWLPTT